MTETAHFQMPCEEEMIKTLSEEYEEKYVKRYANHKDEPADKDSLYIIIKCLRKLNPSTFDFRAAKEYYRVYELNRLEARYVAFILKEQFDGVKAEAKEKAREEKEKMILERYGSWENFYKECGWEYSEYTRRYHKPVAEREKGLPNVLEQFHTVTHKNAKRIGYRGKVNKEHEKVIKNAKV